MLAKFLTFERRYSMKENKDLPKTFPFLLSQPDKLFDQEATRNPFLTNTRHQYAGVLEGTTSEPGHTTSECEFCCLDSAPDWLFSKKIADGLFGWYYERRRILLQLHYLIFQGLLWCFLTLSNSAEYPWRRSLLNRLCMDSGYILPLAETSEHVFHAWSRWICIVSV